MKKVTIALAAISVVLAGLVVFLLVRPPHHGAPTATGGRRILYYRDPMNPANTSPVPRKAPDGMDYVPVYADQSAPGGTPSEGILIDPSVLQNIGVKIMTVHRQDLTKVIRTVGEVAYDETRLYTVTAKISGYIDRLYVDFTGQRVRRDQPLLEIYSPDVVTAEREYLTALQEVNAASARGAAGEVETARELAASARRRLELWDIPEHEIADLEKTGQVPRTVMLHSPVNGVVVEKDILQGAAIEPGMNLFKIADLSRVWVNAQVYEYELPWVRVGDTAEIELSYLPGRVFRGRVVYIEPALSAETRTAVVRIELPNPEGTIELRPNMFATVRLLSQPLRDVLAVPDQAVIRSGERNIVVLDLGNGRFLSRDIQLGVTADSLDQVLAGLQEGDRVVTSSQFLIDSESNLRAAIGAVAPPAGAAPPSSAGVRMPPGRPAPTPPPQPPDTTRLPRPSMPGMPGM